MAMIDTLKRQHPTGIIRSFPRAFQALVAASQTFANFYLLSTGKRAILIGLSAWRVAGQANAVIQIGEGTTQLFPDLIAISGVDNLWTLDDGLPLLEFEATATIATVAAMAAAPNELRVKGTWFEF